MEFFMELNSKLNSLVWGPYAGAYSWYRCVPDYPH